MSSREVRTGDIYLHGLNLYYIIVKLSGGYTYAWLQSGEEAFDGVALAKTTTDEALIEPDDKYITSLDPEFWRDVESSFAGGDTT